MGLLFIANVMMTLFNLDIFMRFLKEKRKENEEKIKMKRRLNAMYGTAFPGYRFNKEEHND